MREATSFGSPRHSHERDARVTRKDIFVTTTIALARAKSRLQTQKFYSRSMVRMLAACIRRFENVDLDRLLDAGFVQPLPGFIAMRFDHDLQRIPQALPALVQRASGGDRAGNFLHPPDEPAVGPGPDNRVVALFHPHIVPKPLRRRQEMLFVHSRLHRGALQGHKALSYHGRLARADGAAVEELRFPTPKAPCTGETPVIQQVHSTTKPTYGFLNFPRAHRSWICGFQQCRQAP